VALVDGPINKCGCNSLVDGLLFTALDNELILSLACGGTVSPLATPGPLVKLKWFLLLFSEVGVGLMFNLSLLIFRIGPALKLLQP